MKTLFFWISVLAVATGLSTTHAAFARPNNVDKAIATPQPDKLQTQLRKNAGAGPNRPYVAAQKNRKSGRNETGTKKNSSCINGTAIHLKH